MEDIKLKKEFIKQIFKENSEYYHPNQALSQTKLLEIVSSDIYTDPKRFLVEMIQNADDSSFEQDKLDFNITFCKNSIVISHQGRVFNKDDIISLCSAGNSTKVKNEKLTGYKGIGFKSIFAHSTKVIICSDGYSFRFDKSYFLKLKMKYLNYPDSNLSKSEIENDVILPWQIIPIWTEDNEIDNCYKNIIKDYKVNFIIFMDKEQTVDECRNFIDEIERDNMYFIFLKSKNLNFIVRELFQIKTIISKKVTEEKSNFVHFFKNDSKIGSYYFDNYEINIEQMFKPEALEIIRNNSQLPKKLVGLKNFEISFAIPIEDESINGEYRVKTLPKEQRIIYAFLPTKVNYNFPFLINSNFTLDAGRSQLMESTWNTELFRILPCYISKFQKNLFNNFGNSFCESLITDSNISCKIFQDTFMEELQKEKLKIAQEIKILTNSNSNEFLKECYLDCFNMSYNNMHFKSILYFFDFICEGPSKARKLLEEYFLSNKLLQYLPRYEIPEKDKKYVGAISKYYQIEYYKITSEEILNFLKSKEYVEYMKPIEIWRLITVMSRSSLFQTIIKEEIMKLPDVFGQFRKATELIIPQIKMKTEEERNLFYDIKVDEFHKYEIDSELLKIFKEQNDTHLLESLKVNVFNEDKKFTSIFNNIEKVYNRENSIDIIRTMFKKWVESDLSGKKQIVQKILSLRTKLLFLTNGNLFIHPHCIVIGKFYKPDSIFENYYNHSISNDYLIPDTAKSEWKNFFIELEMWHEDKCFLLKVESDEFNNMPFIEEGFKNCENIKKKLKNNLCYIYVSPSINKIYDKSFAEIYNFFKDNINFCTLPINKEVKEKNFLNYFKWFFEKKPIPTTQNNLLPISKVLSLSIISDKSDVVKNVLLNNLDFPKCMNIYTSLQEFFKRDKLNAEEILFILEKLRLKESDANSTDSMQIKNYYFNLCCELVNLKTNISFKGFLLDVNNVLRPIKELYFILDPEIDILIGKNLSKKYSFLKVPQEPQKLIEFVNYFKKNQLKVYDKFTVNYNPNEKVMNIEFERELNNRKNFIFTLIRKHSNSFIDPNIFNEKIKTIKFYNCSKISIVSNWNDSFEHGICFTENKARSFNIIFLKDDVYSSWKHPTILYYLTHQLSCILDCKHLHADLITLFNLSTVEEINKWLLDIN